MTLFRQLLANNSLQDGSYALIAAAVFIVIFHLVRRVVLERLARVAKDTNNVFVNFLVEVLLVTRILFALAIGLYIATSFLTLPAVMEKVVDRTFLGLMLLQAGIWANYSLDFWLKQRFAKGEESDAGSRAMTRSLLTFLGRMALWILVVLLILDNMGLNVTALVASLGIGGIAVALAVQNILGDLFASLSIAIDKPFVIGDFIIVDDLMGTVEHVGLKTTRIRSLGGEQIIFSNNDLLKSRISNYKRMQERRSIFVVSVTYDTSAELLELIPTLIQQAIGTQDSVRFDRAHFRSFGPSSLDFEAVYYVLQPDFNLFMNTQQAINLLLVRKFAEHKIRFAFPTQTLRIQGGVQLIAAPFT